MMDRKLEIESAGKRKVLMRWIWFSHFPFANVMPAWSQLALAMAARASAQFCAVSAGSRSLVCPASMLCPTGPLLLLLLPALRIILAPCGAPSTQQASCVDALNVRGVHGDNVETRLQQSNCAEVWCDPRTLGKVTCKAPFIPTSLAQKYTTSTKLEEWRVHICSIVIQDGSHLHLGARGSLLPPVGSHRLLAFS